MPNFKYIVNHKYFDVLNHENSYFLGVLAADGNVDKTETRITLGLCQKDYEILNNFKTAINSTHPIKPSISKLKGKVYLQNVFRFNSPYMCSVLKKYGIVPNKSLRLKFPNIPENFIPDFIRGYFDGDGSITITKQKNMFIYILGTKSFLKSTKKYYNNFCKNNVGWISRHNKSKIFHFCIHGNLAGKSFSQWIYETSNPSTRLNRKYNKMTNQN